jgi:hypothetical protein
VAEEAAPGPGHQPRARSLDPPQAWLYLVTAAAVLLGLWGRFQGLGAWPLNSDEYYIARSVEDILRTGLPQYDCGGYYIRGLLFQYLVALLQWAGMSPELSARIIAAVSSVLVLPAIYLLGQRLGGRTVGLLAIAALSLSAWEVDIARFGRMYAPFQAVFAWYLYFFLRHTVDRAPRALGAMLLLSVIGLFTWEGGILLMLANLLPPFLRHTDGRLSWTDLRYLAGAAIAFAFGYGATQMVDFRRIGTQSFPEGVYPDSFYVGEPAPGLTDLLNATPPVVVASLVLAVLALASLRWAWTLRHRWPVALGLLVATGAALAHQFSLVGTVVVVLLLAGMLGWRELLARPALPFIALVLASAAAWSALAIAHPDFLSSLEVPWNHDSRLLVLAWELLRLPDYVGVVALPWARQAPLLGLLLAGGLLVGAGRVIGRESKVLDDERVVMTLLACLLAAAAMSDPPRFETRYVFFLYPTALVILIAVVARTVARWRLEAPVATAAAASVAMGALAVGGDLDLPRLWKVVTPATPPAEAEALRSPNVMNRTDARSAAKWLAVHAGTPDTLVVNSYPGVDFYYAGFDIAYIDVENQRYWAYACNEGRTERWGNLPLVSTIEELRARIVAHPRTLIVADTPALDDLMPRLDDFPTRVSWTSSDGRISVVEISASGGGG